MYVKKNLLRLEQEREQQLRIADKYSTLAATPTRHKNSLKEASLRTKDQARVR